MPIFFWSRHASATDPGFEKYTGEYIIPVMGPSGAGKSTFINQLLGREEVEVGVSLNSCTSEVRPVEVPVDIISRNLPGWAPTGKKKLILLDTPGFDDTWADDSVILKRIALWLKNAHGAKAKLAGVIYLFDMSLHRVTPTAKRNFVVFEKLCGGGGNCKSVVLGTTKWRRIPREEMELANARQEQLRKVFWGDMSARGSTVQQLDDSTHSAWKLVETVLTKRGNDVLTKRDILTERGNEIILQIQKELVEMDKSLPQTEAARVLTQEIRRTLKLMKDGSATKEDIHKLSQNVRELKPSLFDRLKELFS